MAASATRRGRPTAKWQPPPPPTPKILHFPRRLKLHPSRHRPAPPPPGRNLRSLFDEEEKSKTPAVAERYWKAEAETLRAECDSLRMERDAALRHLHKPPERKKIDGTDCIERKMEKLKPRSSSIDNARDIRGIEESSKRNQEIINVEMLKRKMEGLSKGMIERLEEYGQSQRTAANQRQRAGGATSCRCCCKCKEAVMRIAEGVRAEAEQWAELQEMLEQVRLEMDELRSSRDLWQRRALGRSTASLPRIRCQPQPDPAAETEKRVLVCRLHNRPPLREIGNHASYS